MSKDFFSTDSNQNNNGVDSERYRYEVDPSKRAPFTRLTLRIYDGDLNLIEDELPIETSKKLVIQLLRGIGRLC